MKNWLTIGSFWKSLNSVSGARTSSWFWRYTKTLESFLVLLHSSYSVAASAGGGMIWVRSLLETRRFSICLLKGMMDWLQGWKRSDIGQSVDLKSSYFRWIGDLKIDLLWCRFGLRLRLVLRSRVQALSRSSRIERRSKHDSSLPRTNHTSLKTQKFSLMLLLTSKTNEGDVRNHVKILKKSRTAKCHLRNKLYLWRFLAVFAKDVWRNYLKNFHGLINYVNTDLLGDEVMFRKEHIPGQI